jgi:hypothetical protein
MAREEEIQDAKETLFDARNLVEAIRMIAAENMDDDDDLQHVIQTAARIAVEKIDEVTGGGILDTDPTDNQVAATLARLKASTEGEPA